MKKVLIIVQNLPVPLDRRVWLEATTLEANAYEVAVICPTGQHGDFQDLEELLNNIEIYRYPAPPDAQSTLGYFYEFIYAWCWTFWLSIKVWRKKRFDILHLCNPPETYFLLAWLYRVLGVAILFDHHDLSPEMYLAKGGKQGSLLYWGLLVLEWLSLRSAHHIITTNQTQLIIIMERVKLPPHKLSIVRSGPSIQSLYPVPLEPSLKQGKPFLLAYLGEICSQDGVENLLYLLKILLEQHQRKDIHLVLLGGGPALKHIQDLAQELNLSESVSFLGRVFDDKIRRYLSTSDICLIPDPYSAYANASSMNKVMEYMIFAKPIVGFRLEENRFSAQEAALFAEPNNLEEMAKLVVQLLDNPALRQQMGEFGQKRVQSNLVWSHSIPQLLSAYEKLGK